jgi:Tfp pilus assembly protein PilX
MLTTISQRLRRDDGIAMVAVLMLVLALTAIGIGAIQVAEHSNDVTSVDRERLQTVGSRSLRRRHLFARACSMRPGPT